MKLSPDDPKLTAYALGELNPAERADVERALADSPECRQAVEEIRELAGVLKDELVKEPCPAVALDAAKIVPFPQAEQPAGKDEKVVLLPRQQFYVRVGVAAVAACLIGAFMIQLFMREHNPNSVIRIAQIDQPKDGKEVLELLQQEPDSAARNANQPQSASSGGTVAVNQLGAVIVTNLTLTASATDTPDVTFGSTTYTLAMADGDGERSGRGPADPGSITVNRSGGVNGSITVDYSTTDFSLSGPSLPSIGLTAQNSYGAGANNLPTAGQNVQPSGATIYSVNATGYVNVQNPEAAKPVEYVYFDGLADQSAANDVTRRHIARLNAGGTVQTGLWTIVADDGVQTEGDARKMYKLRLADGRVQELSEKELTDLQANGRNWFFTNGAPVHFAWAKDTTPAGTTASYPQYIENAFKASLQYPLSTFSIDVDTASYANVRRFLNRGQLPPRDAVRLEELINYFSYSYPPPRDKEPFSVNLEVAACPWKAEHRLVRVGIKGREIKPDKRPASNFVFLLDVSGSMQPAERLPLVKQAMSMLVKRMTESDRVAIVVYASEAGVKLVSTSCAQKEKILAVIDALEAGGSTNGGEGIQEAYRLASENFIRGGVNRVILCTDGDFNVGITDQNALVNLIQEKAKSGVYLSALGVGDDNYKDATLQKLADKGNGNYHYIDTLEEAQKVLIEQMNGTLVTIAKDVKIQIEFNPAQVAAYRLIGYEKRLMRRQDFNDDTKDAGEIGAGHTVTALYEIMPAGEAAFTAAATGLKYQPVAQAPRPAANASKELLTLKLRYKQPEANESKLLEFPLTDSGNNYARASSDFKFAASVAAFGMLLKDSQFKGAANFDTVLELAEEAKGNDGYRAEFLNLVKKAKALKAGSPENR
ncbi:MAG: von Willebrand factor type A domain-containing protein [Verrucomicrobiota bacterium]